jgi:hypothetical protein
MRSPILPTRSCGANRDHGQKQEPRSCLATLLTNAARLQKPAKAARIRRMLLRCGDKHAARNWPCYKGGQVNKQEDRHVEGSKRK